MADTIRPLATLQSILPDNVIGGITPQNLRDFLVSIYSYVDGQMQPWGNSTSGTEDTGGLGRFRLARSGFKFYGANDPTRAGSLLQLGDYPETVDGLGNHIGNENTSVFLSMQDMPAAIGPTDHTQFHITGRNSVALPRVWSQYVWLELQQPGFVFGSEIDIINKWSAGYGVAYLASGNLGVPGTIYADAAFRSDAGNGANWQYGLDIDAVISAGTGIRLKDLRNGHTGMLVGLDLSAVSGHFGIAGIYFGSGDGMRWANADTTGGAIFRQWTDDNLQLIVGKSTSQLFVMNFNATHNMFQVNTGVPGAGNTALLLAYTPPVGATVYDAQISVGAAGTGPGGVGHAMYVL